MIPITTPVPNDPKLSGWSNNVAKNMYDNAEKTVKEHPAVSRIVDTRSAAFETAIGIVGGATSVVKASTGIIGDEMYEGMIKSTASEIDVNQKHAENVDKIMNKVKEGLSKAGHAIAETFKEDPNDAMHQTDYYKTFGPRD